MLENILTPAVLPTSQQQKPPLTPASVTTRESPRVLAKSLQLSGLFATLQTAACQAPLFMGFSRQEYWSGSPCPPPGHLTDPETEPGSLRFPALAGRFFASSVSWEARRKPLCPKKGPTCYSEDTAQPPHLPANL